MQLRIETPDIIEYKEKRLKDEWKNTLFRARKLMVDAIRGNLDLRPCISLCQS